eukprot:scaffold76112_cov63-Phaeocystis_antarctica.AAC.2
MVAAAMAVAARAMVAAAMAVAARAMVAAAMAVAARAAAMAKTPSKLPQQSRGPRRCLRHRSRRVCRQERRPRGCSGRSTSTRRSSKCSRSGRTLLPRRGRPYSTHRARRSCRRMSRQRCYDGRSAWRQPSPTSLRPGRMPRPRRARWSLSRRASDHRTHRSCCRAPQRRGPTGRSVRRRWLSTHSLKDHTPLLW